MLKSWRFHAVVAVILGTLALVGAGCWITDNQGEPTQGSEIAPTGKRAPIDQVEYSRKTAPAGETASSNRVEHLDETTPADEAAPPSRVEHSSEAASAGEDAPPSGTEIDDSVHVSSRSKSPAPLRLRIFEASAIVRASLISNSAGAVRYSEALGLDLDGEPLTSFDVVFNKLGLGDPRWPVDGEYRPAHTFRFRVIEYLKGSGASEITVTARTFSTHGTEAQASQVATDSLGERDTSRDSHEAILFLWEPASGGASTDAFHFLRSGPYNSLQYTIDTMNRVWLPAKEPPPAEGMSSSTDDASPLFLVGEPVVPGSPSPEPGSSTMSLGELRSEIAAVDTLIAAGDGTDEYRECLAEMWRYEQVWQGERRVPPESVHQLASGTPEGTVLRQGGTIYTPGANGYSRRLIEGRDKELFREALVDDDDRPDNGYRIGEVTARPLPAGTYQFNSYFQFYTYIPCDFIPYNSYRVRNVNVTAPSGALHELFFDPVTVGMTVAADATNGVLKPTVFTDANGGSATIHRISYDTGSVKITLTPHTGLAGHTLDFIALDGSVSLHTDDATLVPDNNTLTWPVVPQPWQHGDKLMLRIELAHP